MRAERATIVGLVALSLAGCGATTPGEPGSLSSTASSWVSGQPSLARSPAYLAIAGRAETIGDHRSADRARELELIEARRVAALERTRREAIRRFREIRARALARYEEALRVAERRRRELDAQRRRRLAEARRQREELLRKLRVQPGEECSVPEIREQFDCVAGRLPGPED
jgi:hypothetical protein